MLKLKNQAMIPAARLRTMGGGAAVGILLSLEIVLEVSVLALISLYDKHLFCLK